jgi:hypothetical protein
MGIKIGNPEWISGFEDFIGLSASGWCVFA